jgi:hypothetical protein
MRAKARAILCGALAIAAIAGCKSTGRARQADLADDIDAIEAALNDRDRELAEQGVVVAYRTTPAPGAASAPPEAPATPEPPPDTDGEPAEDDPAAPDFAEDAPTLQSSTPEPLEPSMSARDEESEREKSPRRSRRAKADAPTRCERLCGLAESTCDLRDRICRMAERHFGDIRYVASCLRAEDQCEAVRGQCESCAA